MDNIAFSIGSINIYWYSIFILTGVLVALGLIYKESQKHNIEKEIITDLIFNTLIAGFIGARLYYVLFNLDLYKSNPLDIFKIWEGGLAIHGGIIFGLITIIIYTKIKKINPFKMLDILVVGLIIAQAIGRWGNFFNKEAYGGVTTLEELQALSIPNFIIEGMYIGGQYFQPTFYYESLWCFVGFIILLIIRKIKFLKIGQLTGFYLIWYGIGRFIIEGFRSDSLMLGDFKVAQIVSIIFIVAGLCLFQTFKIKRDNYNEGQTKKD